MIVTVDDRLDALVLELISVNDGLQFLLMFLTDLFESIESERPVDLDELVRINHELVRTLAESLKLEKTLVEASPCQSPETVM